MSTPSTIFFLGATGYLGSQLLVYLARDLPQFHITALVRTPTAEKEKELKAIYKDLDIVEGTLDDDAIIQEQSAKADIVINCASSDHAPSVVGTEPFLLQWWQYVIIWVYSNSGRPREKFSK